MSENSKNFLVAIGAGLLTYFLWEKWGRDFFVSSDSSGAGTVGADASADTTGGIGMGTGGGGGAGGGGVTDYSALAAAINALAAGVALPNVQTATLTLASGDNSIVAGEGGKRVCVLAYALTASGDLTASWRTGGASSNLWRMVLSAPTGNSGANLATAWPGYLFATAAGDALVLNASAAGGSVSVTYWQENAG